MSDDDAPGWRERLTGLASDLRDHLERAGQAVGLDVGAEKPYEIAAYRGYGNHARVLVHGRALEAQNLSLPCASGCAVRSGCPTSHDIVNDIF